MAILVCAHRVGPVRGCTMLYTIDQTSQCITFCLVGSMGGAGPVDTDVVGHGHSGADEGKGAMAVFGSSNGRRSLDPIQA